MDELESRIRKFYQLIENSQFERSFDFIDESAKMSPVAMSLHEYVQSMEMIVACYSLITIDEVIMQVHLNERNKEYEGKDYAIGTVIWTDGEAKAKTFSERWIKRDVWKNLNMGPELF